MLTVPAVAVLPATLAWFAFLSFGWWIGLVVIVCFLVLLEEAEQAGWLWCVVFVFLALSDYFGGSRMFVWIWDNWQTSLVAVGAYVSIGVIWSVIKFRFRTGKIKKKIALARVEYGKKSAPAQSIDEFIDSYLHSNLKIWRRHGWHGSMRDIRYHKRAIITWMTCWPPSVIFTLLNDPIRKFFSFLYDNVLRNSFKRMLDRAIG